MRLSWTLGALLATVTPIFGLHFYLEADEERCFIEELPSETIVEGAPLPCAWGMFHGLICGFIGHYRALEYSAEEKKYLLNTQIGVEVEVQVRGVPFALYSFSYLSAYTLIDHLS